MNIYLVPYTGMRHWVLAVTLCAVGLVAWWLALVVNVWGGPFMHDHLPFKFAPRMEGTVYLGFLVVSVSFASVFIEGAMRRRPLRWRLFWPMFGAGIAFFGMLISFSMIRLTLPLFTGDVTDELLADPSLVTLRYRVQLWIAAGMWSGIGPWCARRLHAVMTRRWNRFGRDGTGPPPSPGWLEWIGIAFAHLFGGIVAGAFAAAAWHVPGYYGRIEGDLYLASACGAATFAALHGLLVWPLPEDLYAGWVRVLSYERYGLRIPVPHVDGTPAERFAGHFPRGLDLYLPADRGVAELHASFVIDGEGRYAVRGLSIHPTIVKRLLERIDLRYDVRRPAPLETTLQMEDKVFLGPQQETVIEFLMLPKEER